MKYLKNIKSFNESIENLYRTVIILKDKKMLSKNGTREELEKFIFDNIDNIKRTRTINKSTGKIDLELTITE